MHFVANPADLGQGLDLGDREGPIVTLQSWDIGALVAASHRHDEKGVRAELFGQLLRAMGSRIDTEFAHDLDDFGMVLDSPGLVPPKRRPPSLDRLVP